jgi:arylsulfatase A
MKPRSLILRTFFTSISVFSVAEAQKPNVVFILMDDLGYGDLSCYNSNSGISTPNIDKIGTDGVRFMQAYAACNVSSASRRGLLTGRYPSRMGEWAEGYTSPKPNDNIVSKDNEPCFPIYLKNGGYTNGMFGKWNIGNVNGVSTPDAQGFDYWIGIMHNVSCFGHKRNNGIADFWENGVAAPQYEGTFADDIFVDKAIDFVKTNKSNPFFVYLALQTPHTPYQDPSNPDETNFDWWNVQGGTLGNTSPKVSDRPILKKMVEHIDTKIGELLSTLKNEGIEENTIVILTSDNGGALASINLPLKGYKHGMLEGGIRVPLLIKWPAKYPAGQITDQVAISYDLAQTIINATGVEQFMPHGRVFDGIDLDPILSQNGQKIERSLAWRRREWNPNPVTYTPAPGYNSVYAEGFFKGEWKYIKEFKETPGYARSVSSYPASGYVELLYNLTNDVGETTNLAVSNPAKLTELRNEYEHWRRNTIERHKYYKIPYLDQYGDSEFITAIDKLVYNNETDYSDIRLNQNVPNPFSGITKISLSIKNSGKIKLNVYDLAGKELVTLADGMYSVGDYAFTLNAGSFESGVYFYKLMNNNQTVTKKMIVIK